MHIGHADSAKLLEFELFECFKQMVDMKVRARSCASLNIGIIAQGQKLACDMSAAFALDMFALRISVGKRIFSHRFFCIVYVMFYAFRLYIYV
jgi:hypothetical protein